MKKTTALTTRLTVSILTAGIQIRRITDGLSRQVLIACVWLVTATPAISDDVRWHSLAEIATTAESFLGSRLAATDKRVTARAGVLDPRLKLARCGEPLEPFLRRGTKVGSRTVVGVRCPGKSPWKLYVPVDVIVTEDVLIANRSLPKGHQVTAEDVDIEERDISGLVAGYIGGVDDLAGRRLKRPVMAGRIITPSMLQADVVVQRGQSVTILVKNSTLNISMSGKALSDGAINERIRIENIQTGRVVEGVVRSPEHVEVLVY